MARPLRAGWHFARIVLASLLVLTGCIVGDQLTTWVIHPDGSADWMRFQSNLHSTEPGAKGAEELRAFVAEFEAAKDAESVRINQAGGLVTERRWLRREDPCANVLSARLPHTAALLAFCTLKDEMGRVVVQPSFTADGTRRRLAAVLTMPPGWQPEPSPPDPWQEHANAIGATRVVVAGGQIVASRGFTVAADRRSALLDPVAIRELLRAGLGKAEISLDWELTGR